MCMYTQMDTWFSRFGEFGIDWRWVAHFKQSQVKKFKRLNSAQKNPGWFKVYNNDSLSTLAGLDSLENVGLISISDNPLLTWCSTTPICKLLNDSIVTVHFSSNSTNCDNNIAVINNCQCPCQVQEENSWTGLANDGIWHSESNWSQMSIPDSCDLVTISGTESFVTIENNYTAKCFSIDVNNQAILVTEEGAILIVNCEK